jgi:murein DD-endopeptidase MepM/ murein hydrolase activator NlpD
VARVAALGVLALVAALPASGLAPAGERAAAADRVVVASGSGDGPVVRVQPWATRTPEVREARAQREARRAAQPSWVRPTGGAVVSPFGARWGRQHEGVDIDGAYGAPIVAAAAGVVSFASTENGYGLIVRISHADGVVTAYAHMSEMLVSAGERVRAGELVGRVGTSGNATGTTLHFEVLLNTPPIDPVPFLRERGVIL